MRTIRLFNENLADKQIGNSFAIRDPEQIKHLKVLRIDRNEYNFEVSDGLGLVCQCVYKTRNETGYLFELSKLVADDSDNTKLIYSSLFLPIIHPSKLEIAVEQAVQLNVFGEINLYFSDHNRLSEKRISDNKLARLERLAISAHKQSQGTYIPEINLFEDLESGLKETDSKETQTIVPDTAKQNAKSRPKINPELPFNLVVGPEGGFSQTERKLIVSLSNKQFLRLEGSVLTTETAATVFAGIIKSAYQAQQDLN